MQATFRSHDLVWRPVAVEEHRSFAWRSSCLASRRPGTVRAHQHRSSARVRPMRNARGCSPRLHAAIGPTPARDAALIPTRDTKTPQGWRELTLEDDRYSAGPNLCRVQPASRTGAISHDPPTTRSQRGTGPSISAFQCGARCRSTPRAAPACGTERLRVLPAGREVFASAPS